jgi:hypothetical protein
MLSWYDTVYKPIVDLIEGERFLKAFPGRTASDLYVWIVRHWDELKKKFGQGFPLEKAARDYTELYGRPRRRVAAGLFRFFNRIIAWIKG